LKIWQNSLFLGFMQDQQNIEYPLKSGGRRPGSGRKAIQDRGNIKNQIAIYLEARKIDRLGGKDRLKETIINFVNELYSTL